LATGEEQHERESDFEELKILSRAISQENGTSFWQTSSLALWVGAFSEFAA